MIVITVVLWEEDGMTKLRYDTSADLPTTLNVLEEAKQVIYDELATKESTK